MVDREISLLPNNSFFLFGARGTGKTTLLRHCFKSKKCLSVDLLDPEEEDVFNRNPKELEARIAAAAGIKWVFIDEIQKAPKLLEVIHGQIETSGLRFALTGSSARKLKRGSSNLLAGRAFVYALFPFTRRELGEKYSLAEALQWGTLPKAIQLKSVREKKAYLRAYALTYLKEEVFAEQLVRNLNPFRSFLEVAAQSNGQIINYSKIGDDVGVDTKTVQSYFSILEDTLIGILLPAFHRSIRKQQNANPKFHFFDTGVKRALDRTLDVPLVPKTYAYGNTFEHLVVLEFMRRNQYREKDYRFSYLRTKDGAEIDLIVERPGKPLALVEIKSSDYVSDRDVSTLNRFAGDIPNSEAFCLSLDPNKKRLRKTLCLPWHKGLDVL